MKVIIDTNVIVSANLSEHGKLAEIMRLFYEGRLQMFITADILAEYKRVLAYKKLNISDKIQDGIINAVVAGGTFIEPPASAIPMPDESDRMFYDAAKASGAVLITGNLKHYPDEPLIMNPADFLQKYEFKKG
jgi:putative PIN family toxin of toxin-antitoxin system